MKYFIDTEFIEGFHKPLFGKKRHFIDLISIGIVAEDGRGFYQISCEYNYNDADEWVKKNVILPMYLQTVHGDQRNQHDVNNFHKFYGLTNKQISDSVIDFCKYGSWNEIKTVGITVNMGQLISRSEPEFYGYYADYDWVLFCSLFGRMIDLPKGFPMYCKDLKQSLDNHALAAISMQTMGNETDLKKGLEFIKAMPDYPKQENEHNALADAKWNHELYKFLNPL